MKKLGQSTLVYKIYLIIAKQADTYNLWNRLFGSLTVQFSIKKQRLKKQRAHKISTKIYYN